MNNIFFDILKGKTTAEKAAFELGWPLELVKAALRSPLVNVKDENGRLRFINSGTAEG